LAIPGAGRAGRDRHARAMVFCRSCVAAALAARLRGRPWPIARPSLARMHPRAARPRRPSALQLAPRALVQAALVLALAAGSAALGTEPGKGPQTAAAQPAAEEGEAEQPVKGGQAIVVLVNDEPITAYEIEQRARFLAVNSAGGENLRAKLEARWVVIAKDPRTNEKFQQLLREKNVKSKDEAMALQKQFVSSLQKSLFEQVQRESHAGRMPQLRKQAREELIEERVKVQEAKRLGVDVGEEEPKRIIKEIAARNKMTDEQFAQQVKSQGIDITTMRDKFHAQGCWREVVRRRFAAQIAITQGEVDRLISANAVETGEDAVELQVSKITLPLPRGVDQSLMVRRFADAEALRKHFAGCGGMGELARSAVDARFEDAKYIRPSSVPEPLRSLLLAAKDGDVVPPAATPAGIELFAVCGRRPIKADDKQREKVQNELAQHEFEILAKRHLRDLMQDAHIEYR
jgi:peptidyl-prolyl cis-trans isomerase SurA